MWARAGAIALGALLAATPAKAELPTLLEGLSEQQIRDTMDFVVGNLMFVMFHEAGHMMIDEFDLPVLGKEEDSVDMLSSVILLKDEDEYTNQALESTAAAWVLAAKDGETAGADLAFWDVHGLDRQRAYNVACLAYGKNPERFSAFADALELPDQRRYGCGQEYQDIEKGWSKVLAEHVMPIGGILQFPVTYEPTENPQLQFYANVMKGANVLGVLEQVLSDDFIFEDGIRVTAKECGFVNAYWSPADRELVFCYELMGMHAELFTRQFRQ